MADDIRKIITELERLEFATDAGRATHAKLRRIKIDNGAQTTGDTELGYEIMRRPDVLEFFGSDARTEIPVAGFIRGKFISRRIDRMVMDNTSHTIRIMDYKTDIDKTVLRDKYVAQIGEYKELIQQIYPGYNIHGFILWTHDWTLEEIY